MLDQFCATPLKVSPPALGVRNAVVKAHCHQVDHDHLVCEPDSHEAQGLIEKFPFLLCAVVVSILLGQAAIIPKYRHVFEVSGVALEDSDAAAAATCEPDNSPKLT